MAIINYRNYEFVGHFDERTDGDSYYCIGCGGVHQKPIHDESVVIYTKKDGTLSESASFIGDPVYAIAGFMGRHYSSITPKIAQFINSGHNLDDALKVLEVVEHDIIKNAWSCLLLTSYGIRRLSFKPGQKLNILSNKHQISMSIQSGRGVNCETDMDSSIYIQSVSQRIKGDQQCL